MTYKTLRLPLVSFRQSTEHVAFVRHIRAHDARAWEVPTNCVRAVEGAGRALQTPTTNNTELIRKHFGTEPPICRD